MNEIKIFRGKNTSNYYLINGVDADSFSITRTLDESFDYGTFNVVSTNQLSGLKPKSYITIQEFENSVLKSQEQFRIDVIGNTIIRQTSSSTLYENQITFIEKTSELQDIKCPNIETCQPLPPMWKESQGSTEYQTFGTTPTYIRGLFTQYRMRLDAAYSMEVKKHVGNSDTAQLQIPPFIRGTRTNFTQSTPFTESDEYYMLVTNEAGTEVVSDYYSSLHTTPPSLGVGKYHVRIYYKDSKLFSTDNDWKLNCIFFAYDVEFLARTGATRTEIGDKYHTAYEVLQKLIWTIKPYKTTNKVPSNPKYTLASDCDFLKNELCPDLYLTNNDLYANLLLISRNYNCIPYLDDNDAIHFLDLGARESLPNGFSVDNFNGKSNITEYDRCGALVSDLQNMIVSNKLDSNTCTDTWRTLECEVGQQFTADNAFYRSDYNIYQLKDFRIKYWDVSTNAYRGEVSALKYMFESTVYNCLDATSTGTINSRSYALCYEQYGNKITGFTHRSSEYTLSQLNVHSSICYIIRDLFGVTINDALVQNWNTHIMCQAIYEPVIDARVKQYRSDTKEFNEYELQVSQQTNLGSLELVGDSMKNSHSQTGNKNVIINTFVDLFAKVPEINQCVIEGDDIWKVSKVVRAFSSTGYDLSVVLTKNFNRISANQSLAVEKRWADVPLKGAIKRTIHLEDYATLYINTSRTTRNETDKYITANGQKTAIGSLFNDEPIHTFLNKAMTFYFQLKNKNGTSYPNTSTCLADNTSNNSWIRLPMVVGTFGNSIVLKATCKDNYSATTGIVSRTIGEDQYKFTIDIPYCDENGEGLLLNFKIGCEKQTITTFNQGNCLTDNPSSDVILAQGNDIYIDKGSREQLEFIYQLHFVSGAEDIVIGKSATQCNLMVVDKDKITKRSLDLYIINHKLTQFEQTLPADAVRIGSANAEVSNIWTIECDVESGHENATFSDVWGVDTADDVSIGLYATYPVEYYDERGSAMKSELVVARTLKRYQIWGERIKDFNLCSVITDADYPFANS